jgi:DNA-binding XRE family transcriptional regulator
MILTDLGDVTVKDSDDSAQPRADMPVRLRVGVYDRLAASKGYVTVTAQAELHKLNRATMHALRNGENVPRLDTAMRMAADLGVAVEVIWERVAAA